jgi:hypothetical protein
MKSLNLLEVFNHHLMAAARIVGMEGEEIFDSK